MNLVRHECGFSRMESRFPTKGTCLPSTLAPSILNCRSTRCSAASFRGARAGASQLRELFASYVETKQAQNVLDCDDLLLYWAQTVSDPQLADDIGGCFDHVLVDEYQDTNSLQASILMALKPGGRGLTVVGDGAQSIYQSYAFRLGGFARHFRIFAERLFSRHSRYRSNVIQRWGRTRRACLPTNQPNPRVPEFQSIQSGLCEVCGMRLIRGN